MIDKTAIDALRKICSIETGTWDNPVPFSKLYHEAKGIATEALAVIEAEKPADDETDFERSLLELSREPDKAYIYLGYIKKQFSESYHAEQCKARVFFCSRAREHCEDRDGADKSCETCGRPSGYLCTPCYGFSLWIPKA